MDDSAVRTLWCGNLSSEVADEILFELFIQAGPLEKVSIPKDRDGRSKGYGFVTFKHECSVPYAMDLMKGIQLFGRPLNLQNRTGAKADNSYNDNRSQHHQRSMSLQEDFGPHQGVPNMDPQSFNTLLGMAGLLSGNPMLQGLVQQVHQGMMQPPHYQNHQRNRSHQGGDRYYDGNNREDRRDFYNSGDRHRSRDNDYRGGPRDNDYHDRHRGGGYRDNRDRGWDRDRERDRDRNRDRSRSNNRPYDNRYRQRD